MYGLNITSFMCICMAQYDLLCVGKQELECASPRKLKQMGSNVLLPSTVVLFLHSEYLFRLLL